MSGDHPAYARVKQSTRNYYNTICVHCGDEVEKVSMIRHEGQLYCPDCYDDLYFTVSDPLGTYNLKKIERKTEEKPTGTLFTKH